MNNLKFVAISLFVIFVGLFIFSQVREDGPGRDVASIEPPPTPKVEANLTKREKVIPPSEVNMDLATSKVESIPEPQIQTKSH